MLDEYRNCVSACANKDYAEVQSVEAHNQAVDRMRNIVKNADKSGTIRQLATLLDGPYTSRWLAPQLVELVDLPQDIETKCFLIVEKLAAANSAEAMGFQMWLKEWKAKRGRI